MELGAFLWPEFSAEGLEQGGLAGQRVLPHMLSIWLSALVLKDKSGVLSDCESVLKYGNEAN